MKVARENHRDSSKIRVGHSLSRSNNVPKWTMGAGPYEHMIMYKPCTRLVLVPWNSKEPGSTHARRCRSYWTIESRIIGHGEAVAQSWLRARGSDQPQLAKKLRDNSSQNYETWGLLSLSWIAVKEADHHSVPARLLLDTHMLLYRRRQGGE
ncbi:hypothetical protein D5086_007323 [Populus alba]|uniref:Uncharacterized protein n=1 Tax=Populus alba TaxID=43335 RepID=A0ACC4CN29_POPAL